MTGFQSNIESLFVKVCCIASVEEAKLAINSGATALGLVGPMPSGPGIIDDTLIQQIVHSLDSSVETFLLTSETEAVKIIEHHSRTGTSTIQLVDEVKHETYQKIKHALPEVKLVQVIHVQDETSIKKAIAIENYVDAILLDSGNPNLDVKELGGTGRTHNWNISKRIVESVSIPVILAGGLNSNNVAQAMQVVQAFGLDLCSGVRTNKRLNKHKLRAFFNAVRNAYLPNI